MSAPELDPVPIFYRPDPEKERWVMAKLKRLERRGPREYVIVGQTHDGRPAESRIGPDDDLPDAGHLKARGRRAGPQRRA